MNIIHFLFDGTFVHADLYLVATRFINSTIVGLLELPFGVFCRFFVIIIQHYMNFELLYDAFYAVYYKGQFMDVILYEYTRKTWILLTEITFVCFLLYRHYRRMPWSFAVGFDEDEPNPDDGPMDWAEDDAFSTQTEKKFEINYAFFYGRRDYLRIALTYRQERALNRKRKKRQKLKLKIFKEKWEEHVLYDKELKLIKKEKKLERKRRILLLSPWKKKIATYTHNLIPRLKRRFKKELFLFSEKMRVKKRKRGLQAWAMAKAKAHYKAFLDDKPRRDREYHARKRAEAAAERARELAFLKQYRKDMREFRIILAIEKHKNEAAFKQQQEWNKRFYGERRDV